jgi:hypothetical protein
MTVDYMGAFDPDLSMTEQWTAGWSFLDCANWFGDNRASSSCCVNPTGNVDGDAQGLIDIGDLTALIAYLYIPPNPAPLCPEEANIDGDNQGLIDIGDLTALIAYLYIPPNPAPADCQ